MGVWVNAILLPFTVACLAMSNTKPAQPLRATRLRGARANCEYGGAGGAIRIRWNNVLLAFAATKRSSLGHWLVRLTGSAIQADD